MAFDIFGDSNETLYTPEMQKAGIELVPGSSTTPPQRVSGFPAPIPAMFGAGKVEPGVAVPPPWIAPSELRQAGRGTSNRDAIVRPEDIRPVNAFNPELRVPPPDDHLTPPGQLSPMEIAQVGKATKSFGEAISSPAIGKFLAALGMGISPWNTKIGEYAMEANEARAQQMFNDLIKEGKTPDEINIPGLSAEGKRQLTEDYYAKEERDRRYGLAERTETRLDRTVDLQEKSLELRGEEFQLMSDKFSWEKMVDQRDLTRKQAFDDARTLRENMTAYKEEMLGDYYAAGGAKGSSGAAGETLLDLTMRLNQAAGLAARPMNDISEALGTIEDEFQSDLIDNYDNDLQAALKDPEMKSKYDAMEAMRADRDFYKNTNREFLEASGSVLDRVLQIYGFKPPPYTGPPLKTSKPAGDTSIGPGIIDISNDPQLGAALSPGTPVIYNGRIIYKGEAEKKK